MSKTMKYKVSCQTEQLRWESIEIPGMTTALRIQASMPELCRCMAFIIVKDSRGVIRLQKLLGHGEQNLGIGLTTKDTSIGGVPGEIQKGIWQIGIGIFTEYVAQVLGMKTEELRLTVTAVCGESDTVDEEAEARKVISDPISGPCWVKDGLHISPELYDWNKIYNEESRWYKGDFHTHTHLSDGKETITNAMKKAKDMELDFYVPTEHNLVHTGWCDTSLCILPGIEITTDFGHMNLFGITEFPDYILKIVADNGDKNKVSEYMNKTICEAKEKGWLTSINHPFLTIWSWRYEETVLDRVNCLEIMNDPTYPDAAVANDKAVRFIDELWKDGHRIFGIGGSDSHNLIEERYKGATLPSIAGDPGTYVFCDGLTPKNLMKHVKEGHMCVTRFLKIEPHIIADGKEYLPGENLGDATHLIYNAIIREAEEKPIVYLINNGSRTEVSVKASADGVYEIQESVTLECRGWQWIRLEIRNQKEDLLGYVNPVYKGNKQSVYTTFGEIAEKLCTEN